MIAKTALIAAVASAIALSAGNAFAEPYVPVLPFTATPTPYVIDPCMLGEPIDTTVTDSHGNPAPGHCPIAVIPWGAHR